MTICSWFTHQTWRFSIALYVSLPKATSEPCLQTRDYRPEPPWQCCTPTIGRKQIGPSISSWGTPIHHPFLDGIFPYKPSIWVISGWFGGFHSHGGTRKWMVYVMEHPNRNWMMNRGTPISGNLQISCYFCFHGKMWTKMKELAFFSSPYELYKIT